MRVRAARQHAALDVVEMTYLETRLDTSIAALDEPLRPVPRPFAQIRRHLRIKNHAHDLLPSPAEPPEAVVQVLLQIESLRRLEQPTRKLRPANPRQEKIPRPLPHRIVRHQHPPVLQICEVQRMHRARLARGRVARLLIVQLQFPPPPDRLQQHREKPMLRLRRRLRGRKHQALQRVARHRHRPAHHRRDLFQRRRQRRPQRRSRPRRKRPPRQRQRQRLRRIDPQQRQQVAVPRVIIRPRTRIPRDRHIEPGPQEIDVSLDRPRRHPELLRKTLRVQRLIVAQPLMQPDDPLERRASAQPRRFRAAHGRQRRREFRAGRHRPAGSAKRSGEQTTRPLMPKCIYRAIE